ncbi:MAG: ThuA domain-containing protein [bacterium]|jgi:type 1 glutamine amidotransferase
MKKLFALQAAVLVSALALQAAPPIRVMILDGESGGPYHNWQAITPALKLQLEQTGLFQVDVVTAPPAGGDYSTFKPDFNKYQAIVFNYDAPDERWPDSLKASFEEYMKNGGGLVIVHAADNAFPNWQAFNEMIGIGGWRGRNEKSGPLWYFKDGKLVSDNSPGNAGVHGARLPFRVTVQDPNHPITRGLPKVFMHQGDELYAKMRGPGKNMTVLATAYSDPANRGTGNEEPALMVLTYGKGRIFHSIFGHDVYGLASVDAVVTFQRGTEWAATGKVTQKVPSDFPTERTVSYRTDIAALDPNYSKGLNPLDTPAGGRRPQAPKPAAQGR